MNFRKKTTNVTKVLYIILAMCILSILALTLYSLLNQENNDGLHLQSLQNQDGGAEDALADIFKPAATEAPPVTTQKPAATAAPATTVPPETMPAATESAAYAPEIQAYEEDEQPALITPEDEIEDSVEVMSVPDMFMKPLNGYVSKQHNPDIPVYSIAMNDYRTHKGIDIDSEIGANVKAAANGFISEIRDDPLMGKTIVISHAGGIDSIYSNLQPLLPQYITEGAQVKIGEVIGGVGQSALIEMTEVPHLHFEMTQDGEQVNPFDFINFQ